MNCSVMPVRRVASAHSHIDTIEKKRAKVLRAAPPRTLSQTQAQRIVGLIEDVIRAHDGNVSAAARSLGMRQQTLSSIKLGAGIGLQTAEAIAMSLQIPVYILIDGAIPRAMLDVLRETPQRWSGPVVAAVSHWPPLRLLDREQIRAKLDAVAQIVDATLRIAGEAP